MKRTFMFIALCLLTMVHATMVYADTWNGSASAWTHGSGTESDPYLIESAANLAYLAEMVNGGISTYSDQYFKLTTDVNLNSRQWTGIGINENVSFQGIFDGGNHSITNINTSTALFAYVKNSTIKNTLSGGSTAKSGIVQVSYGTLFIDNCHSAVSVTGINYAGGIVGFSNGNVIFTNCSNTGNINSSGTTGGIIGQIRGTFSIEMCFNTGIVSTIIREETTSDANQIETYSCTGYSGGIIGLAQSSGEIKLCYNNAACSTDVDNVRKNNAFYSPRVYSYAYSGGIIGKATSAEIRNCYNRGNIYAKASSTSLLYRPGYGNYQTQSDCAYGYYYSSGISNGTTSVTNTNCYNTGTIAGIGSSSTSSRYGISNGSVTNSYYLSTCGGSGDGVSKTADVMKSDATLVLLNITDNAYIMDLSPNINDGYPIFASNICYVVTEFSNDITFHGGTINGRYTGGDYWPGGTSDVQGFEYKNDTSVVWATVYTNIGSPFEYNLIDLTPNTTYNYRAFVTKDGNTYYGEIKSFTTLSCSTLTAEIETQSLTICTGDTATLTASGNSVYSENYTYHWNTNANTAVIKPTEQGTYTVIVTDDNGCTATASVSLSVNPRPEGSISGNTTICPNGNVTLTASGANSYTWSTGATTPTLTTSTAGTYTCTFRNSYGCTSTQDVTISVYAAPVISGTTTICSGNSTTLTASGADSYTWSTGATTPSITVSEAGTYTVMGYTDGCNGSAVVTVVVESLPTITISGTNSFCQGGNTTLTATGGSSYVWANGSDENNITVNSPGIYTVTGIGVNGCSNTASIEVAMRPSYVNMPVSATICEGNSYNFFGTMLNEAGTYNHSGTTTAGCDSVVNLTLTVNPLPTATISGNITFCEGGNTTLIATGGVSYTWSDGATTSANTVTNAGTYGVTVTGINGCSSTASTTVTVNTLPTITISGNTAFCEGNSTMLTAQGGNSYTWSNGAQTAYITVTSSGNYTVTGVGANGCSNTASVTVTASPLPTITIGGNTSFCQGGNTTLTASGADSYAWSNGTTTPSITVDAFGVYSVTGTTALGCTGTASVTVTVSPNPTITITGDTELCPGETTTLTANGGTSYMWFDGSSNATYQTSTAGNYSVIGYNDAGCYAMASVDVHQYDNAQTEETATGTGEYVWNGNIYTESGDYTFTTTTAHGCDSTVTLHLTIEQGGGQGIDDITDADDVKVYAKGGKIVVVGAKDEKVHVYDVMGRVIKQSAGSGQQTAVEIPVTSAGVYMVKVGDQPSRKVLVRP